jgi:TPR repeat protein
MYEKGLGLPQDYGEAVKWYRKAAELGHAEAQHNLGLMNEKGLGVPQDFVRAHMWFNLAVVHVNEGAKHDRDRTASLLAPDQIAEAQRMAREWMAKHQR